MMWKGKVCNTVVKNCWYWVFVWKDEGVIAAGAFGDVVKVQRKKDGSFYAMKVLLSILLCLLQNTEITNSEIR